ncbi:concanavalin A-like lectin/glucanase domain-containing protein [Blastocladiella britannica]|nr:concanavalin A-like lectin/glucanase domain-containing protein [Blastocladiella britannica]
MILPPYLAAAPLAHRLTTAADKNTIISLLPTAWSPRDKCAMLDLAPTHDSLRLVYVGPGRSDSDAAAARSDKPIPADAAGLYYFEVRIVDKGRDGYIGIGFSAESVHLNRLPGWEPFSWGYHGDDGNVFSCSGAGKPYGPTFTTNDVIGCGIDFAHRTAFFTKNGLNLGTAFTHLPLGGTKPIYPSVGMRTQGEIVEANFGGSPFVFDATGWAAGVRRDAWNRCVVARPAPASSEAVADAVLEYLVHAGLAKAADAFVRQRRRGQRSQEDAPMDVDQSTGEKEVDPTVDAMVKEMGHRGEIRHLILAGTIDKAQSAIATHYPGLLDRDVVTRFALDCQHFVELVRAGLLDVTPSSKSGSTNPPRLLAALDYGRTHLAAAYLRPTVPPVDQKQQVLDAGRVAAHLRSVFALAAYPDPRTVPAVAPLLDLDRRTELADAVNAAARVYAGAPARAAIEVAVAQARACSDAVAEMASLGTGSTGDVALVAWDETVFRDLV